MLEATRGKHGGWSISTMHGGYRVQKLYIDYTKRQALSAFARELREGVL